MTSTILRRRNRTNEQKRNYYKTILFFFGFINPIIISLIPPRMICNISYIIAADCHSITAIRSPCNCFDDMGHGSATEDA